MKKVVALITLAALSMSLVACGAQADTAAPAEAEAPAVEASAVEEETSAPAEAAAPAELGDVLIMATNAAFPPYEYIEGDEIVGIDAEIAAALADKLGMELQIDDIDFGSIIPAIQSGKASVGLAGMTVTEERLQNVNFSESYATGVQVIIVPEGSDIASPDDLEGKIIGCQESTTGHIYCAGDYGDENVVAYTKGADAIEALKTGKVDCVVIDNEPAKAFVAANEGLVILETEYVTEEYAIAIAKENEALLEAINNAMAELKADGTIDAIIEKYIPAE